MVQQNVAVIEQERESKDIMEDMVVMDEVGESDEEEVKVSVSEIAVSVNLAQFSRFHRSFMGTKYFYRNELSSYEVFLLGTKNSSDLFHSTELRKEWFWAKPG